MGRMAESQGQLDGAWGLPEGGVAINERVWYRDDGEVRAIFYGLLPFYSCDRLDKVNHKFAAVQLIEAGLARQNDVAAAFGLSVSALCRARQVVARAGIGGLLGKPKGPTGRRKATRGVANRIAALRKKGQSHQAIADRLGISPSTVNRVLRERGLTRRVVEPTGRLPFENDEPADADSEGEPSGATEPLTVDVHSEVEATSIAYASPLEQFATRLGLIEEAPVEFAPARDVPMAGVLLGVALLPTSGLMEEARRVYGRLQNGWYGLRATVWMLFMMALLRIKRPEQLTGVDPAWRALDKELQAARAELQKAEAAYGRVSLANAPSAERERCAATVEQARDPYERLCQQRRDTPRQVRLGDVSDGDPVKLTYERKLLTDTIKMCACDVETQLTEMLAGVLRRQDFEGRAVVRELFQTPGDLSLSNGQLHVHFNQLSAPRYTTALMSLCEQLNARDPTIPETAFTLRFHVKPRTENKWSKMNPGRSGCLEAPLASVQAASRDGLLQVSLVMDLTVLETSQLDTMLAHQHAGGPGAGVHVPAELVVDGQVLLAVAGVLDLVEDADAGVLGGVPAVQAHSRNGRFQGIAAALNVQADLDL
ncbi:MAG: helix-turn-helix domain-containing protein [Planctomycetes bacterium]|nr:helix-turn-helix domain-containing protein [Planctomycetota bacterium]